MTNGRKSPPKGRAAAKEFRRQQLIESTIESIAKRGFADTTLANVAEGAGMSRGIVNFHFQSKDTLLVETLQFLAEEYKAVWTGALAKAGPTPAEQLTALIEADFDPAVCNRKKIAVWYAFWGEAKSRPTYRKLCDASDQQYADAVLALCERIIAEGDYSDLDPGLIASGFAAMSDGLWLDALISPRNFDRERAKRTLFVYLACAFPRHFALARDGVA